MNQVDETTSVSPVMESNDIDGKFIRYKEIYIEESIKEKELINRMKEIGLELKEVRQEKEAYLEDIKKYDRHYKSIVNSTIWSLFGPFRKIKTLLKK